MKRLNTFQVGIDSGDIVLFSDFEEGGEMWRGSGPRDRVKKIKFSAIYQDPPSVTVGLSLWDLDSDTNVRVEITAENITVRGFDLVFRTWGDTRIARARASWQAIGSLPHEDDWQLY